MIYNQILCLGDSLTYGARDEDGLGYPPRLAELLSRDTGQAWMCVNKGVCQETTPDILRRAYDVIRDYPECPLVLLLSGTNDLKSPQIHPDQFSVAYKQIITICLVNDKRLVVGLIPPVGPHPHFGHRAVRLARVLNKRISLLAKEFDLGVADFSELSHCLVDGVHFGAEGYQQMAVRWMSALKSL